MDLQDDILDTSQLCFEGDFNSQVEHILQRVRLLRGEVKAFDHLYDDLESALGEIWPGCVVKPFGSIVTGLGIKTSDVDCFISLPLGVQSDKYSVIKARNVLERYPNIFQDLFAIPTAKVPIVKFIHAPSHRFCDISFKSLAGVRNSKLIACLLDMDVRALTLAILIKYWSKVHNFTGTRLLSNYSLIMLVIFYLQQKKILPPVIELQRRCETYMVDNWDTAFDEQPYDLNIAPNNIQMFDLLGGFFTYYNAFDFSNYVISTFIGRPIPVSNFESINEVPVVYNLYKHNVTMKKCKPLRNNGVICIQDPFEHDRNCCTSIHSDLLLKIRTLIHFAAKKYTESNDYLRIIFTEDPRTSHQVITKQPIVFHNKIIKKGKNNKNKKTLSNFMHTVGR